jgi:glycosyltransferase involved in cell wall biosynthesis
MGFKSNYVNSNYVKLSIILPVYNVEKFLERCIESVINQSIKEIEIIIVNDGSTDKSLEIINKFAAIDSRIVVINKENEGYGASINKGIKISKGEYIGIVETDDWIDRRMYEKLYSASLQSKADIVKSNFFLAYSNGNSIEEKTFLWLKPSHNPFSVFEYPRILEFKPSVWSAIYNRKFLISNNIWMLETPGASFQDLPFTIIAFSQAKKIFLFNEPLYYYYQGNPDSSVINIKNPYLVFDLFDFIGKFFDENEDLKYCLEKYIYRLKFCHYLWNFNHIERKFQKPFFERFRKEFCDIDDEIKKNVLLNDKDVEKYKFLKKNKFSKFCGRSKFHNLNFLREKFFENFGIKRRFWIRKP